MQIESDRHTIANNSASQAALQRIHVVEAAKCSEKRSISRGWKVWLIPWIRLLLSVPLFSGIATFAQTIRFRVRLLSKKLPDRRRRPCEPGRIIL